MTKFQVGMRSVYSIKFKKQKAAIIFFSRTFQVSFFSGVVTLVSFYLVFNLELTKTKNQDQELCLFSKDQDLCTPMTFSCSFFLPEQLPSVLAGLDLLAASLNPPGKVSAGKCHSLMSLPWLSHHTTMTSANSCSRSLLSSPRVSTVQSPSVLA